MCVWRGEGNLLHILYCLLIQFREHEWFQKDLPAYLFPATNDQDTSLINTSALMEVCEVS